MNDTWCSSLPISLINVRLNILCHSLRSILRDSAIEAIAVSESTAQQFAHWQSAELAQNIPTSHIESRLDVWMSFKSLIHHNVHMIEFSWIYAQQRSCQDLDTRPCTFSICWKVDRTQRCILPNSLDTNIGGYSNNRGVKLLNLFAP